MLKLRCKPLLASMAGLWTGVAYIGKSKDLRQIVHGAGMSRANNDYTYMAPSKVLQTSSPRVFVNGRLNEAIRAGSRITWWWLVVPT